MPIFIAEGKGEEKKKKVKYFNIKTTAKSLDPIEQSSATDRKHSGRLIVLIFLAANLQKMHSQSVMTKISLQQQLVISNFGEKHQSKMQTG